MRVPNPVLSKRLARWHECCQLQLQYAGFAGVRSRSLTALKSDFRAVKELRIACLPDHGSYRDQKLLFEVQLGIASW